MQKKQKNITESALYAGKPMTIGVSYRVNELADKKDLNTLPKTAGKVYSLIPLQEIISEIMQVSASSKQLLEYEN